MTLKDFYDKNKQLFERMLLEEAVAVKDDVQEILQRGRIDLAMNAHHFVSLALEGQETELQAFAAEEGAAWAAQDIALTFRLEWIHALRRTIWLFMEAYQERARDKTLHQFFQWERKVNNQVDGFLYTFLKAFTTSKETLIHEQAQLVDNLSTPLISLGEGICMLPLIGPVDERRITLLQENILTEVAARKIHGVIIDLSGVTSMEDRVVEHLVRLMKGVSVMGSETVLTGIPQELALNLALSQEVNKPYVTILSTLQQAISEYLKTYPK